MPGGSDSPSKTSVKSARPATTPKASDKDNRRGQLRVRSRSLANGGIAANAVRTATSFLATTVNVSIGGCLLRTYEALEPGMDVTISLKLPEGNLNTPGRIVHVNEDAVGCRMCGVRFAPLGMDSHALLLQHIATFGGVAAPAAPAGPTAPAAPVAPVTPVTPAGTPAAGATSTGEFVIEGRIDKQ